MRIAVVLSLVGIRDSDAVAALPVWKRSVILACTDDTHVLLVSPWQRKRDLIHE